MFIVQTAVTGFLGCRYHTYNNPKCIWRRDGTRTDWMPCTYTLKRLFVDEFHLYMTVCLTELDSEPHQGTILLCSGRGLL